jgi:hypothetical protein
MRNTKENVIYSATYTSKGGLKGQIIEHVRSAIRVVYKEESEFNLDIGRVRPFLQRFYTMQDDGTVVAKPRRIDWALEELRKHPLQIPPERILQALSSPEAMILRRIRTVQSNGQIAEELTLGHDSVALALERWHALDAQERFLTAESQRKQEIRKVKKLEEEVTKSRGAYSELVRSITPSVISSAANVVVAGVAFVYVFLTQGEKIIQPIHEAISKILPISGIFQPIVEGIVKFAFSGFFALVVLANFRNLIKRVTIVEYGSKKRKLSGGSATSNSKTRATRVVANRRRK